MALQFSRSVGVFLWVLSTSTVFGGEIAFHGSTAEIASWNLAGKSNFPDFVRAIRDLDPEIIAED